MSPFTCYAKSTPNGIIFFHSLNNDGNVVVTFWTHLPSLFKFWYTSSQLFEMNSIQVQNRLNRTHEIDKAFKLWLTVHVGSLQFPVIIMILNVIIRSKFLTKESKYDEKVSAISSLLLSLWTKIRFFFRCVSLYCLP